jgi:Raf kinase inhibitor-like YbhB/YbcL family protein
VRRRIACLVLSAGCLALAGCGGGGSEPSAPAGHIAVSSPSIAGGQAIPAAYTCTGKDISPPLHWNDVPKAAAALRLEITDLDARGFVHWKVTGIPPDTHEVAAGKVPKGGRERRNGFGKSGYGGPCPPRGEGAHRYAITVSALGSDGKVLDEGSLVATFKH